MNIPLRVCGSLCLNKTWKPSSWSTLGYSILEGETRPEVYTLSWQWVNWSKLHFFPLHTKMLMITETTMIWPRWSLAIQVVAHTLHICNSYQRTHSNNVRSGHPRRRRPRRWFRWKVVCCLFFVNSFHFLRFFSLLIHYRTVVHAQAN